MKTITLHNLCFACILLLAGVWPAGAQQQVGPLAWHGAWSPRAEAPYGTLAWTSSYNRVAEGLSFSDAAFQLAYHTPHFSAEGLMKLNQRQHFTFMPGRLIIEINDSNVIFADSTGFEARPDRYSLDEPVGGRFSYRGPRWQVSALVSTLVQRARLEEPQPQQTQQGLYFINWTARTYQQMRLVGSVAADYRWGPFALQVGVHTLPLVRAGDADFRYAYQMQVRPFVALATQLAGTMVDGSTDARHLALAVRQNFGQGLFGGRAATVMAGYQHGFNTFRFEAAQLQLRLPLAPSIAGMLGYEHTWTAPPLQDVAGFMAWQSAGLFGRLAPLNSGRNHQRLSFGVQVHLRRKRAPLRLLQARLLQAHIYSAKQAFYASNPVGLVDVYNEHDTPMEVQIVVETTKGRGRYQSEAFTLDAGASRQVPFYLYLQPGHTEAAITAAEQLVISAVVGHRRSVLTSLPITFYGRHAWDGNTWGLHYFVAPDDPVIKKRANQLFLNTLPYGTAAPTVGQRMDHLRAFLSALGDGLRYIPDPTTTRQVDQVQYPVETLSQRGGDCEDLTVLTASSLMAVGIHTAVVDIRPQPVRAGASPLVRPGGVGHVFLLVDTGLPPTALAVLGLSELQVVTRRGVHGRSTLWIPVEPTVLSAGFDAAFEAGVRLYYQSVIVNNGVVTGDVQIHDF